MRLLAAACAGALCVLAGAAPGAASEPFREENVRFASRNPEIEIAGSLTLPESACSRCLPAVILVSGSGPDDRDNLHGGHKLFLTIAQYLSANGIAVLRYDDRGVGKSTPLGTKTFFDQTIFDFADDAAGAIAFAASHPALDPTRIHIAGHSEGGLVVAITAAGREDLAGVILLAASALPTEQSHMEQRAAALAAGGMEPAKINARRELARDMFRILHATPERTEARTRLLSLLTSFGMPAERAAAYADYLTTEGYRALLETDPADYLERIQTPTLAMSGSEDLIVLPKSNLAAIAAALAKAEVEDVEILTMLGLDHMFLPARTETDDPSGAVSMELLIKLREWIAAHEGVDP